MKKREKTYLHIIKNGIGILVDQWLAENPAITNADIGYKLHQQKHRTVEGKHWSKDNVKVLRRTLDSMAFRLYVLEADKNYRYAINNIPRRFVRLPRPDDTLADKQFLTRLLNTKRHRETEKKENPPKQVFVR